MSGPPGCCPHQEAAIDLLSRRHALHIVWLLQQAGEARRFNEIKRELAINPVSLCQRLTELEGDGIVIRRTYRETPPRVEYSLSVKGRDLVPIIDALGEWARRHREAVEAASKAASSSPTMV